MYEVFVFIRISNSVSGPVLDKEYRFLHLVFPPLFGTVAQIVVQPKNMTKNPHALHSNSTLISLLFCTQRGG